MLSLESKCLLIPKIENFLKTIVKKKPKDKMDIFISMDVIDQTWDEKDEEEVYTGIFICNSLELENDEKLREKILETKILDLLLDVIELKESPFSVPEISDNYVMDIFFVLNEFILNILEIKGGDRLKSLFDIGLRNLQTIQGEDFFNLAGVLANISPNLTFAKNWNSFDFSNFFKEFKELILINDEGKLSLVYLMSALVGGFVQTPSKVDKYLVFTTPIINTMIKHLGKNFEIPMDNKKALLTFMVVMRNDIHPWMNTIFLQCHQILKKQKFTEMDDDSYFVIWMIIQLVDVFGDSMETNIASPGFIDLILHYSFSKDVKVGSSAISLLQFICRFKIMQSYIPKILVLHKFNPETSNIRVV
jgi:hypothetical protein